MNTNFGDKFVTKFSDKFFASTYVVTNTYDIASTYYVESTYNIASTYDVASTYNVASTYVVTNTYDIASTYNVASCLLPRHQPVIIPKIPILASAKRPKKTSDLYFRESSARSAQADNQNQKMSIYNHKSIF